MAHRHHRNAVIDEDVKGWVEVNTADRGNWNNCPMCHSDQLDGEDTFEFDDDEAEVSNHVRCLDCGTTWTEVYKAACRENIEEKEIKRRTFQDGAWHEVNLDTDELCESCTTQSQEVYHRKVKQ
jgi:hypothetical protein